MKINDKLKLAMARYYSNRDKQYVERSVSGSDVRIIERDATAPRWDKQADFRAIDELACKSEFGLQASAGSFWFHRGRVTIECNESNYLDGGKRTLVPKEKKVSVPSA